MAVMAVPIAVFNPGPWGAAVFAGVFTTAAVHALVRRAPHLPHHLLCSGAMVYMAVAMAAAGPARAGHAAHLSAGTPVLTGLFLLYFTGYVLRTGFSLVPGTAVAAETAGAVAPAGAVATGTAGSAGSVSCAVAAGTAHRIPPAPAGGAVRLWHAPEVAAACRVSMALAMLAMLLAL